MQSYYGKVHKSPTRGSYAAAANNNSQVNMSTRPSNALMSTAKISSSVKYTDSKIGDRTYQPTGLTPQFKISR
jgi:hypothetical protein